MSDRNWHSPPRRLLAEAWQHYERGRYDAARSLHLEALALLDRSDDPAVRAGALNGLGLISQAQERYDEALRWFDSARQVAQRAGDDDVYAQALTNTGRVHHERGRHAQALECCEHALAVQVRIGDAAGQARTLGVLGEVHQGQGRSAVALEHYHRGLSLLGDTGDPPSRANLLGSIGLAHQDRGHYDDALEHYEQALAIHERFADRAGQATTHSNIGLLYETQGRYREALDHLDLALSLQQDPQGPGEATTLNNIARVHHEQGHAERALEGYERALEIVERTGRPALEARTHSNIGGVLSALDRPDEAIEHYTLALRILDEVDDPAARAAALHSLGVAHFRAGRRERAIVCAKRALSLCVATESRAAEVTVRGFLARLYWSRLRSGTGDGPTAMREAARREFEEAVRIVEELREAMLAQDSRAWFFSSNSDIYRAYASFLASISDREIAFAMAQRGKARSFLDVLGRGGGRSAERHEELWSAVAAAAELMRTSERETERENASRRVARLQRELRALERADRHRRDDHRLAASAGTTTVDDVRARLLSEDGAVLEYLSSDTETLLFCVTASEFEIFPLSATSDDIGRMVEELRTAVSRRVPAYPHGHALYEAIIGPAEALLRGKTDLLICPDGALCYLPFALLLSDAPDGRRTWAELPYLINGIGRGEPAITLRYSSSAHVAAHFQDRAGARRARPREDRTQLVALAYPEAVDTPRGRFGEIGETVEEVWEIAALLAKGPGELPAAEGRPDAYRGRGVSVLTNAAATKSSLLDHAAHPHRFLHLATHGYVDTSRPELSGLFLAAPAGGGAAPWLAYEIANDTIDCDLVTVSGCETALGPNPKGEGVVSLIRSFQQAGAETVCATLWPIFDRPAREVMRAFYTHIVAGARPADALVAAQRASRHEHPAHWAAYTIWQ